MAGVDNRIVTMKFDNRDFENNARTTMSTLARLKESMDFGRIVGGTIRGLGTVSSALQKIGLHTPFAPMISAANKGLAGVGFVLDKLGMKNPFTGGVQSASELQKAAQTAAGPAGIGAMETAVQGVSNKFVLLSTIAITAISNITNKIINSTTQWLKGFTMAPILGGLEEYQTNLKSIQTIQANTDRPLPEINRALDELNQYSDQTIYNFGEMAKNIGTFTAAGVDLKTSVSAIKGIANMAALSGSNSQQAATAMYQLSQALASGKVGLMDWNSVVNAGMGGKKLQNALAQTAVAMGDLNEAQVKGIESGKQLKIMGSSFRESIMAKPGQESWLTSDILKESLASLDGRYSVAAQKQALLENGTKKYKTTAEAVAAVEKARNEAAKRGITYTDEQFKALQKLSTSAFESATKVKTLGQVFEIAKETIGSGWSASFRSIFGNLKEAKKLFTGMSEGLNDIIKKNALARNNMLAKWKKMGGRDTLIDGLKDAWKAFYGVLKAVGQGFRDVFPKQTADGLLTLTQRFADFMHQLLPSKDTLANIRDIAGGVAAVFHIIGQVIGGVASGFKTLFDAAGGGKGDFLSFAAGIGDSIKNFDKFLEKSGIIETFFTSLGNILSVPLALLKGIGSIFSGLFSGFDAGAAASVGENVDKVGGSLSGLKAVGQKIADFFGKIGDLFRSIGEKIGAALIGIGDLIGDAFSGENFGKALDTINTTLFGALILMIRNFFKQGVSIDLSGGLFDSIKATLGSATAAFENMQAKLKADILIRLAIAIGLMAASLLVLSTINPKSLTKALVAMSAGLAILMSAMYGLSQLMGPTGVAKLMGLVTAMNAMAGALLILAAALKLMASMSFGDMLRGLFTLNVTLNLMTKAMIPLAAGSKGMVRAAGAMILMGVALNILATALKIFATMDWMEMIRGLAAMGGTLLVMSGALKIMPDMKAEGIGLVLFAGAVTILAVAMKIFSTMSWPEIVRGLVALAGTLLVIAGAVRLMPKTMMLQAAGLVLIAGAVTVLAGALRVLGGMSVAEIAKALVTLGGSLILLAIGVNAMAMTGILGATALVITAAAVALLVPSLVALGALNWGTIIKSLATLAGAFVVLGVAGYVLAPLTPVILGLGAAMLLIGAGFSLAGMGALYLATAVGILVGAGAAGARTIMSYIDMFLQRIPQIAIAFAQAIVGMAIELSKNAPILATTFMRVLNAMLTQAIKIVPKLGKLAFKIIDTFLDVIERSFPRILQVGLRMLMHFLIGLARNMDELVRKGTEVVVQFMRGVAKNGPRLAEEGYRMMIKLVNGLSRAIDKNAKPMGEAGGRLGISIIKGIASGISGAAGVIKDAALDAAKKALNAAKDFFGVGSPSKLMRDEVGRPISEGTALGIRDTAPRVAQEVKRMSRTAFGVLSDSMKELNDAIALDPNFNPTVAPVLDLTSFAREAVKMEGLLATNPVLPTVSYNAAADISAVTQASAQAAADEAAAQQSGDTYVTYEQHLHSPTALDSVKIYRDGKSLISLKRQELATP